MAGRIISMQRQARELGRLRTGYTDTSGSKPRPVKSETWVITSHAEHYVIGAAEAWGGTVEKWQPLGGGAAQWRVITQANALDAILPPGDPLSQSYELWSGGGCARRCDGVTETLSDGPCICRAQHGEDFHEQRKGAVCAATTRLNVFLPEMPDVGVFRVETHSYYAAGEIAGAVDLIRSAVGPDAIIPIRLRIEQRQRKAEGKTKQFPVVVVELRGITTGQVLGASVMGGQQLAAQAQREAITAGGGQAPPAAAAIEAGPSVDVRPTPAAPPTAEQRPAVAGPVRQDLASFAAAVAAASSPDDLSGIFADARKAGVLTEDLKAMIRTRATQFGNGGGQSEQAAVKQMAPGRQSVPMSTDPDELWAQIQRTVPDSWTSSDVERDFANFAGTPAEQAGAGDMTAYLKHLKES